MRKVPVSGPIISQVDKDNLHAVIDKGWFTEGEQAKSFARKLRAVTGSKYVTLCNSGSSANLLALSALKKIWDERKPNASVVITCATGFPTTVAPIIQVGYMPAFVEMNFETLAPDYGDIISFIEELENDGFKVAGIVLAHTLGFPYNERYLRRICDEHTMFLLADCCDALGSQVHGDLFDYPVGAFAHASTYSFFPAHHITTGEGGAVMTDDGEVYKLVESFTNWGRLCRCKPGQDNVCGKRFGHHISPLPKGYDHKYTFSEVGYNLKMTELQAALGNTQIDRLTEFTDERRYHYRKLHDGLAFYSGFQDGFIDILSLKKSPLQYIASPFGFPILEHKQPSHRKMTLCQWLEEHGVGTRPLFAGDIRLQPMMNGIMFFSSDHTNIDLSQNGSEYIMKNAFWIGVHPALTTSDIEYVISTINEYYEGK